MRISIELVVIVLIILIVALVALTIFTGGMEMWTSIWSGFSEEQLAKEQCKVKCYNLKNSLCYTEPTKLQTEWGNEKVSLKGVEKSCSNYVSCKCDCKMPGERCEVFETCCVGRCEGGVCKE